MGLLDMIRGRAQIQLENIALLRLDRRADDKITPDTEGSIPSPQFNTDTSDDAKSKPESSQVTYDAQPGIQKAEAVALVWTKNVVYVTYAWIWLSFFLLALQSSINASIIQNAYSNFSAAPQVSTAQILANVIGGVLKLPIAKVLNLWGRAEGLFFFTVVYIIGLVILAACNGPNVFAAGYILYWVGYDALYLILDLFIADTFGLRNRGFAFAFASTPFICTAFTGPLAAQSFIEHSTWRWAYGAFAIIMPVVFAPLMIIFKYYQRKAEESGVYRRRPSGRRWNESIVFYLHEFDVVGALLLTAAFVLVLLPFSLQSYGRTEYNTPAFISMITVGFVTFFLFAIWEKFFTRAPFIRYELFKDRTVLGASLLAAVLFCSFYCWDHLLFNFCVVFYRLPVGMAGYVDQIYNTGSCFWSVIAGVIIRQTRRFKPICLFFGVPLVLLGTGLMIYFCGGYGSENVGYLVMCQIFISFAGGTLVIGEDLAVMASSPREGVPMLLSMLSLFSSLGSAVGFAASAAVYSNIFPATLCQDLPDDSGALCREIYQAGYTKQVTYPVGSRHRLAIDRAWTEYMKYDCITATSVLSLAIPLTLLWRDLSLDRKQNKGVVI